jgi:hypothetical protein
MDRQLEEGQGTTAKSRGSVPGRTARRGWARGRYAAPAPDGTTFPAKLIALVRQRFPYLNGLFNALPDGRAADDCLYTTATILWLVVLGFLCRKGTRNAMDVDRNTGLNPANLMALSGQRRWPDGRPLTAPCTQTATRFLDILLPGYLELVLVAVAQNLLRSKLLDNARFVGRVLIAFDGTKQENFRRWSAPWRRKYRYVLHAKIIGPNGTAFTVMAEPCDHYDTERGKLDCERAAFQRLAQRLKTAFPRLPICLLGDALFACEAVFALCQRYDWKFIFTLKEGSHPVVFAEAVELLPLATGQVYQLTRKDFRQDTRWVDNVAFGDRRLAVVFQGEADGTKEFFCAWATNFLIANPERAAGIAASGRWRSRIEESYNVQKNGGFGLEHAFRETDRGAANYHLLMQLAHTIEQLLFKGWLRRELIACRRLTDICLAKLLAEALHAQAPPLEPLPAFQLRFADG